MKDASPTTFYLKDYAPFPFRVKNVHLTFQLDPLKTRVISLVEFEPIAGSSQHYLFLHDEDLRLIWAKIDGAAVSPQITKGGLSVRVPSASFVWECEVEIDPQNNTSLEGLYMSNGMYCTQCEAEGFRKITYYPDRPDVMAQFHVRIEGDLPILLSNGNPKAQGENPNFSPHSFLELLMSTPTIRSAPAIFAPCSTLRPIPPRPNTTTVSPGWNGHMLTTVSGLRLSYYDQCTHPSPH